MSVFKTTKEIETSKANNTITGSGDVYRAGERSGAYANIDSEIVTTMKEVPTTWGKVAPFVTPALTAALAATGVGLPLAGVIGAGGGALTGALSANNGIAENDATKRRIKQVIPIKGAQHEQGGVDLKVGGVGVEAEGGEYKIVFDDDTEAIFNQGQMNMLQQGVDPNEIIDTMPKIDEVNTAEGGIVNKVINNFKYKEKDTFKDSIPLLNEIINDIGRQNHQTQLANLGIGTLGLIENEALNNRIQKKDFYTPIKEVNYAPTRMQRIDTMPEMRSTVDKQVNTGIRGLTEAGKSDRIGTFVEAANQSLQSMQGQQNQIDAQLANQEASLNAQGQQRTDSINAQIRAQNAQMELSENQLKSQADSNTAQARQANLSGMIDTSEGDELMLALKKYGLIFGDQGDNTQPQKEAPIAQSNTQPLSYSTDDIMNALYESEEKESGTLKDTFLNPTRVMNALRNDINKPTKENSNTTVSTENDINGIPIPKSNITEGYGPNTSPLNQNMFNEDSNNEFVKQKMDAFAENRRNSVIDGGQLNTFVTTEESLQSDKTPISGEINNPIKPASAPQLRNTTIPTVNEFNDEYGALTTPLNQNMFTSEGNDNFLDRRRLNELANPSALQNATKSSSIDLPAEEDIPIEPIQNQKPQTIESEKAAQIFINEKPVAGDDDLMHNESGYSVVYDNTTGMPKETEKKAIIIHKTGSEANSALESAKGGTGYHYLVKRDGTIVNTADPKHVTYHAGNSRLRDFESVNDHTIGIEFEALQTDSKIGIYEDFTPEQLDKASDQIIKLMNDFNLTIDDIFGHNEITAYADQNFLAPANYKYKKEDFIDTDEVLRLRGDESIERFVGRKADGSPAQIRKLIKAIQDKIQAQQDLTKQN